MYCTLWYSTSVPNGLLQLQKHYKKKVQELRQSLEVMTAKEEQLSADKEAIKLVIKSGSIDFIVCQNPSAQLSNKFTS